MQPNPWNDPYVSDDELVLECDKAVIDVVNERYADNENHKIHTEIPPQPFIGNPLKARVLLLLLNPSWDESDIKTFSSPDLKKAMDANLKLEEADYPFYVLDPQHKKLAEQSAIKWWSDCLSFCIDEISDDKEKSIQLLSKNFAAVEFHGYHSKKYSSIPVTLPSQTFGFSLVKNAIKEEKLIIVARGKFEWECAVPELLNYENRFDTKNKQQNWISPGNITNDGFARIIDKLKD